MSEPVPNLAESSRIFVLDDNPANLVFMQRVLEKAGYENVLCSSQPEDAESICRFYKPDLVILDLHMPGITGYEILERLRSSDIVVGFLPILVYTADITATARHRALELGATDFLTKPGDISEITFRVRNFLEMRHLYTRLEDQNVSLEEKVRERTQKLMAAQIEIVQRLALAGDYHDDETGEHCRRVGELSHRIALEYGLNSGDANLIRLGAPLHDIGKVGVPDAILHKHGKLTTEEYDAMKLHTIVGAMILADSRSEILRMAHQIAISHHECWNGTGYPEGQEGEDIPISGRIVSVADVFDALTHSRSYKEAWPVEEAIHEIERVSGTKFDPAVVAAFGRVMATSQARQAA